MALPKGWTGLRYPAGDPENGPAYRQTWNGVEWKCSEYKPEIDPETGLTACKYCGDTKEWH